MAINTPDPAVHDGHVVQRLTDGHIAVSSHDDNDEDFQAAKEMQ
jgi:hypothetical protein